MTYSKTEDLPATWPPHGGPETEEPWRREVTNHKIARSIAFMKQHVDQPLQAAALAAQANISLSHYFALFKRLTGCTPIDYFIQLRMRRACDLLNATSLSVKEVAAALGYEDPFYFSRVFKSVNSIAPRQYRSKRAPQQSPASAVSGWSRSPAQRSA